MSPHTFVKINTFIGAFFAFANGVAALIMARQPGWALEQIAEASLFSLAGIVIMLVGAFCLVGLVGIARAVRVQIITLAALLLALNLWGLTVIFGALSEKSRISWTLGVLSGLSIYLVFFFERSVDREIVVRWRLAILALCFVAVFVDLGVFIRVGFF